MTTEDDLQARREAATTAARLKARDTARHVLAGLSIRHRLTTGQTRQLLDMVGLLGDPEDDGVPVVLPHAFSQPAAKLSAPASGTYR